MTKDEARRILDLVCSGFLDVVFSGHFWMRVDERLPGFTRTQVLQVLRTGEVRDEPVPDDRHGNHKVRVRASIPDAGQVEIVLAIAWFDNAIAVTIYSIRGK